MIKDASLNELRAHIARFKSQAEPHQSALVLGGTGPNVSAHVSTISALTLDYIEQLSSVHVMSGSVFSLMSCLAHRQGTLNRDNFENSDRELRNIHKPSLGNIVKYFLRKRKNTSAIFNNAHIRDTVEMLYGHDFVQQPLSALAYPYRFYAYCANQGEVIELSVNTFPDMTLAEVTMATICVPYIYGQFAYRELLLSDPIFCPKIKPFRKSMFSLPGHKMYVNHKRSGLSGEVYFIKAEERLFPDFSMSCDFLSFNLGLSNRYVKKLHRRLIKDVLTEGE